MKRLVEFPLQEGGTMLVEVDEPEASAETTRSGVVKAARPSSEVIENAKKTFEEALDKIKPAAQSLIDKLGELHDAPDEIGVEFGIKFSAEAGAFIASAGVEANYKVTLKWVKTQPQKKPKKAYRVT
ncbi:hypothetical protein TFLX_05307 [Thermoflexales bacterium]|nr:hypothetical protein TFLX_05307 [Thermoflexales bacterium]